MPEAVKVAADRLRRNDPTLTTMTLRGENIGDAGARALANALEKNTTLIDLNLDRNNI